MTYLGPIFFFLAVAAWSVGIPIVVARCNLRNGLPITYGMGPRQFLPAIRNFNGQDWRFAIGLAISTPIFIALAIRFGLTTV